MYKIITFSCFRRNWYKIWQSNGFYVLAIDYRGYGDSSRIKQITETSLVQDALSSLRWLQNCIHPDAQILIWGHSLGTGVSCKLGSILSGSEMRPKGYVLESPFDSMYSISRYLKENGSGMFGWVIGVINWIFDYFIDTKRLLKERDLLFDSVTSSKEINEKVVILHAKDDAIVPFQLGKNLHQKRLESSKAVECFLFEAEHGLGHDDIWKYKELQNVIEYIQKIK